MAIIFLNSIKSPYQVEPKILSYLNYFSNLLVYVRINRKKFYTICTIFLKSFHRSLLTQIIWFQRTSYQLNERTWRLLQTNSLHTVVNSRIFYWSCVKCRNLLIFEIKLCEKCPQNFLRLQGSTHSLLRADFRLYSSGRFCLSSNFFFSRFRLA